MSTLRLPAAQKISGISLVIAAARRIKHLYPLYLAAIVVSLVFNFIMELSRGRDFLAVMPSSRDLVYHLLLIHTLSADTFFGIVPALWFIGVLAHLIFLYPVFHWMSRLWGGGGATVASYVVSTACLAFASTLDEGSGLLLKMNALGRWFEWCVGAYIADLISRQVRPKPLALGISSSGLIALCLAPQHGVLGLQVGVVSMAVVLWALVGATQGYSAPGFVTWFIPLSGLTYGVYLMHQIFLPRIGALLSGFRGYPLMYWALCVILCLGITIVAAWTVSRTIDQRPKAVHNRGSASA
ncbi:hypothetical protein EON64_09390 [archaeon]|nr:MAG: hypothetical protein EON64_09390 [archaeon]